MPKKDEGQKYIDSVLALVPEAQRAAVKEALSTETVLDHVGEHVMLRSDYSRAQDHLREQANAVLNYKGQLDTWYSNIGQELARGSAALQRLEQLKTTPGDEPPQTPPSQPPAPASLRQEDVDKLLQDRIGQTEQQTLGLVAYITSLAQAHYARYSEALDVGNLIADARKQGRPLPAVYEERTREKREALEKKEATAAREKLREEVRAEVLAEVRKGGHGAYPLPGADSDPNVTLSGLAPKKEGDGQDYGVRAALNEFYTRGQNVGA